MHRCTKRQENLVSKHADEVGGDLREAEEHAVGSELARRGRGEERHTKEPLMSASDGKTVVPCARREDVRDVDPSITTSASGQPIAVYPN